MRLATVVAGGREFVAAVQSEDRLLDLAHAARLAGMDGSAFASMQAVIDAGPAGLDAARSLLAAPPGEALMAEASVVFRAPLPRPVRMRDCLAFEAHLRNAYDQAEKRMGKRFEIPAVWYEQPIYYKCNHMAVIGHGQDTLWPSYSSFMDYELELAVIIGKGGADIPAERAMEHVFGYTIFNDMSARDAQLKETPGQLGPTKGKDFDTGNILGPYILTADEVAHPAALDMEVRVNGERWGGGNSREMHHSFARIISYLSTSETLYAGEVIGSGTVGTGCALEVGRQLSPGDVIELTIERIGTLRNRIVKPQPG
ncbi:fumarylacetoacetate hydrolase family protein [Aquibium sp. ELW1220]|uniref:fumarylacetoacetate hydrolase family protein n=1 Tax=Aquibium sp. ELW1220 TaxID=2976766 RepID=UPI0025B0291C|nr:fumarylacetoacetate hydrolase family protein [Aquibium sp. ELW1220]MDN2581485.1 fumarylacetoacetate hydrolase family protein [Aquibium sp. ELW1220]